MSEQKSQATQQMVEAILSKGHAKNHDYFLKEKAKIEAEHAAKWAEVETNTATQKERITKTITQEYAQKEQRDLLQTNQGIVHEKQHYLEQLFDLSLSQLKNLQEADFLKMVKSLLISNDLSGQVAVQVGEYSQGFLTEDVLADFAEEHPSEINYQLMTSVLPNDGGFILAQDGIEYNFLFSSILAQVSEEKEFALAESLLADGSD